MNIRFKLLEAYEYYFVEFFNLKEVNFGVDEKYQNKQWTKTGNKISSYFLSGETLFKVDLIFDGTYYHVKFSYKKGNEFTYKMRYDLDSSLSLFNRIMYIVSETVDEFYISSLAFGAHESNEKLKPVYDRMITNKSFLKMMSSKNFYYVGEEEGIHLFKKEA